MIATVLLAALVLAQENTGSVSGIVIDSVTRSPVHNAEVSITPGTPDQKVITDASGRFELSVVDAGDRNISVRHRDYLTGNVLKRVVVKPGQAATPIVFELVPSGSVSGRVLDEDGDPLDGCSVQPRQDGIPVALMNAMAMANMTMRPTPGVSAYRLFNLKPGTYVLVARCNVPVFEPRPLPRGPDPLTTKAYQPQFSEPVTLAAGAESFGVDFRMRPMPVTHVHVTLAPGEDWRGRKDLGWELIAADPEMSAGTLAVWHPFNPATGGFEIQQVFAGSYTLLVTARTDNAAMVVGAVQPITVGNKPVEIAVPLRRALDVNGRVEFDDASGPRKLTPAQAHIQFMPEFAYLNTGVPPAKVEDDGTFTLKSAFPGPSRLHLNVKNAFLKAAWIGGEPVVDGLVDLSNGPRGDLRVVISTNTATLQGTAEPDLTVWASPVGTTGFEYAKGAQSNASGVFRMEGLAPGTYRIAATEMGNRPQGGQEVSVAEGETKTITVK